MIEYLYNTIRATAGDDMHITAIIKDDAGEAIADNCHFMIFNTNDELMSTTAGTYDGLGWAFTIPTTNLDKGKYWYCISHNNQKLCFKQRLYIV